MSSATLNPPVESAFRKTRWGVIWLLTLTLFSAITAGGLLAPLQEAAKADLHIDDFQLALIVGRPRLFPSLSCLSHSRGWCITIPAPGCLWFSRLSGPLAR